MLAKYLGKTLFSKRVPNVQIEMNIQIVLCILNVFHKSPIYIMYAPLFVWTLKLCPQYTRGVLPLRPYY